MTRLSLPLLALAFAACAHVPTGKELQAADIHYDLGVHAVQNNNAQEALREFLEAVKMNPEFPEAYNALGLVYQWSYGRLEDAKKSFEKALELKPDFAEAWNNLGTLHAERGELEPARLAYEKALADPLYKTPWMAQTNLGWVIHRQGKSAVGEQFIRAALTSRPTYCVGHRQLARLLDETGRKEDGEASWEAFASNCPDEPEAMFQLATIQVRRGQESAASRSLMKCLAKAGVKPIASECRAALAKLPPLPPEPETPKVGPPPGTAGTVVEGSRDLEER